MVSSKSILRQYKPLLLSSLGEFKYDRFEHVERILDEIGDGTTKNNLACIVCSKKKF